MCWGDPLDTLAYYVKWKLYAGKDGKVVSTSLLTRGLFNDYKVVHGIFFPILG